MKGSILTAAVILGLGAFAAGAGAPDTGAEPTLALKQRAKVYIVQMASDPVAAYAGDISGLARTKPAKGGKLNAESADARLYAAHLEAQHDQALAAVGGRKIYDYDTVFNGFAAVLTPGQAGALEARDDVLKVWPDELLKPQTNSTPDFLGLTGGGGPWSKGNVGEDVVIGIIDTGIQPDHPSLADVPTPKKGNKGTDIPYNAPPSTFTGTGCNFGNSAFNPDDAPFTCNDKLLTADAFSAGFQAANPMFADGEFLSARDSDGHGTHTT